MHIFRFDPSTATWTTIAFPNGTDASLSTLQEAVGGWIAMLVTIRIGDHQCDFYVDDEALLKPEPAIGYKVWCTAQIGPLPARSRSSVPLLTAAV